jgi:hypothetical protein
MRFAFLLPLAIAASCGGVISGSNDGGGVDGGGGDVALGQPCNTSADCANGGDCAYPVNGGCAAAKQCFPRKMDCKGGIDCACGGSTTFDDCNGGAQKPIAHSGPCDQPPPPPPPSCNGPACEVCDITGFTVSPQSKPYDATHACSQQDIASFVTACLSSSATQQTCSSWQKSDAGTSACFACLVTQDTSANWGPIVCTSNGCTLDTGGCIDIVSGQVAMENGTNGSCGDLTNAANECVDYVCGACQGTSDDTVCVDDAQKIECKSYFDATANASTCALFDGGANECSPQSDADYPSFLNIFCGTGP